MRWGLGPGTVLRVTASTPATLTMSLRTQHKDQTLQVWADKRMIHQQDVPPGKDNKDYSLATVLLPAGTKELELRYGKWQENKDIKRAILFRRLTIEPAK